MAAAQPLPDLIPLLAPLLLLVTCLFSVLRLIKRHTVHNPHAKSPHEVLGIPPATWKPYLKDVLQAVCPALGERFSPLPWAAHPLIQSTLLYNALHVIEGGPEEKPEKKNLVASDEPVSNVSIRRMTIHSLDGGTLALDWIERAGAPLPENGAPVLLHFPGLSNCLPTIGFGAMLVGALQEHCLRNNLHARAASVIYPGFAGHILDSHKLPGSGYVATDDCGAVLRCVRTLFPEAPIIIVGCSFGSAMVANWLVRHSEETDKLKIALTLLYAYGHSTAAAVWAADNDMFGGASSSSVVRMWKNAILDNPQNLAQTRRLERVHPGFSVDALRRAKSVRQWDVACLPVYGFASIPEMFSFADPVGVFHHLSSSIPVVVFNADDDWLCPSQRLQEAAPSLYGCMRNVALFETIGGGHLGWVDCLDLRKDKQLKRKRSLQILSMAKALHGCFRGSSGTASDVELETGAHCRWLVTTACQVFDAALAGKLLPACGPE